MHKNGMVDIVEKEKENKAGLVVAWWEAHNPMATAQAQKTKKMKVIVNKRGPNPVWM
jgi:hypothetical protein